jgi:hypothetical protein
LPGSSLPSTNGAPIVPPKNGALDLYVRFR